MGEPKLTAHVKAGGCASKLSPKILDQVLPRIPRLANRRVLVGFDTADDAGVYQLTPDCALVQTVDFFTPIVDDPYTYGLIAAANSLSDVYAMGGWPLTAMNIVCWPVESRDPAELAAVLQGSADKLTEAGVALVGGHSDEVKFGYSVTGTIHPLRILTNAGARPGDVLVFTKRIGTGVISTALKRGFAEPRHMEAAIESMLTLNREACETMLPFEPHGCTDITGFGLIGHAREMALASEVTLEIDTSAIRFLPGALEYSRQGAHSGGLKNNREFASCVVETRARLTPEVEALLYDPQTSGGLLAALPEQGAEGFLAAFPTAYRLGCVRARAGKPILLI
ncbi:MAG: selenide, water dikinase SelD [Acidobacteria bacterium]|nr:selenide, water dikinase SelD [Acidobacteriota bacterium]